MPTKLGAHQLNPITETEQLIEAGSPVLKIVDDFGAASRFLAKFPNGVLIGRIYDPRTAEQQYSEGMSPEAAADQYVDSKREKYRLNPLIKYWEGHNEPVWDSLDKMAWYARFEIRRTQKLKELGLHTVIGSFSTGTPHIAQDDLSWWEAFKPALINGAAYGSYLGLHEYFTNHALEDSWNFGRHRKVWDWFLKPNGISIPIVITEFGTDYKIRPTDYVVELANADHYVQETPYVLGLTIFTFGDGGNPAAWDNFNIRGWSEFHRLVDYVKSMVNVPPTPVPIPPQPPAPKFVKQNRVKVVGAEGLNIRKSPGLSNPVVGVALLGTKGWIFDGPVAVDGIQWYLIGYDNDILGWSSQNYLVKV